MAYERPAKGSEFITVELRNKLGDEGLFIFFVGTSILIIKDLKLLEESE
jgi:hypothetical protein